MWGPFGNRVAVRNGVAVGDAVSTRPWIVDDDLWALIEPLLPPWPEKSPGPRPVADRLCLQGILYVLYNDIAWQLLPLELGFGPGQTSWRRLERWQQAGVFDQLSPKTPGSRASWSRPGQFMPWPSGPPGLGVGAGRRIGMVGRGLPGIGCAVGPAGRGALASSLKVGVGVVPCRYVSGRRGLLADLAIPVGVAPVLERPEAAATSADRCPAGATRRWDVRVLRGHRQSLASPVSQPSASFCAS
ncbi:transposase [Streptomyces sp. NBC_00401]|uniref:transposase n=1 Tax=Streptomyces sp. NBC_00401 TaxID=2975738 RepID=UPI00338E777C